MKENFQIKSSAVTDRGLNERRVNNEDSYLEMPEHKIFAVADGVGGAQAGEMASKMAVEIIAEAFANLRPEDDAEEIMKQAIKKANTAVYRMSQELPQLAGMATTVVALHISGNIATIGHVGDSRLYRLDPRGNLFRETQDHSIVEEEVRAGRMTPAQAAVHPSRNVISRAIGAEEDVEIDLKTIMIEPNTTFLLCSDGITRHIEDYELREILLENPDPQKACERMKQVCYRRGAEDNLTAVIVKVGSFVALEGLEEEKTISSARTVSSRKLVATADLVGAPTKKLEIPEEIRMTPEGFESKTAGFVAETGMTRQETAETEAKKEVREKVKQEKTKKKGLLARIFQAIFLVALGVILGATLYHFGLLRSMLSRFEANDSFQAERSETSEKSENVQPALSLPVVQEPNIEYRAFEDSRRNVDKDPEKYIQLSQGNAETAEDFYLLGRAYFLTGQYLQAKQAFDQAKLKLSEVKSEIKDVNRETLEVEIAIGLSIVENGIARREFINQRSQMAVKSGEGLKQASNKTENFNSRTTDISGVENR